jgi:hypothetical protein
VKNPIPIVQRSGQYPKARPSCTTRTPTRTKGSGAFARPRPRSRSGTRRRADGPSSRRRTETSRSWIPPRVRASATHPSWSRAARSTCSTRA